MLRVIVCALLLCPAAAIAAEQEHWFPDHARHAAAEELAARLTGIETPPEVRRDQVLASARQSIDKLAARLDAWGLEGLLDHTPDIVALEFPAHPDPIPVAIGRWGGCALGLYEELAEGDEELFAIATSNVAIMVVSAYLRHRYLLAGGTDEALKQYLTGEGFSAIELRMAESPELREEVNRQCAPSLLDVLE